MTTNRLSLLFRDRAHVILDLEAEASNDLDHVLVVLAQLFGKLIDADLRHGSGLPPRGQRRGHERVVEREQLPVTRVLPRVSRRALVEGSLRANGFVERRPEGRAVDSDAPDPGERPVETAALDRLVEAGARRTEIGGATDAPLRRWCERPMTHPHHPEEALLGAAGPTTDTGTDRFAHSLVASMPSS
ncbi:MAG: hypothetical protein R3B09_32900 [Nannocystaceae bacterium]